MTDKNQFIPIIWDWHEWAHNVQVARVGRVWAECIRGGDKWFVLEDGVVIADGETGGATAAEEAMRRRLYDNAAKGIVPQAKYRVGQSVVKDGGDYTFTGTVVSAFQKKSRAVRYVVENADGILHIFSESQLREVTP